MTNKYTIDTSFISSIVNQDDQNHQQAIQILEELEENSIFYLPAIVELELSLLSLKYPKISTQLIENCLQMFNPTFIQIDKTFINNFKRFCEQTQLKLKSPDYAILYSALLNKSQILSFDQKLIKIHQKLLRP